MSKNSPTLTATHIAYLHICPRKLWLHVRGVEQEHESENVALGLQLHEQSYERRGERFRELQLPGIKIDYYDAENRVVHEVKKSDKMEPAHRAQLLYYLYVLEGHGIEATGLLEYPKLRRNQAVRLGDEERRAVRDWIEQALQIIESEVCPPLLCASFCKSCAYFDFCYADEELPADLFQQNP